MRDTCPEGSLLEQISYSVSHFLFVLLRFLAVRSAGAHPCVCVCVCAELSRRDQRRLRVSCSAGAGMVSGDFRNHGESVWSSVWFTLNHACVLTVCVCVCVCVCSSSDAGAGVQLCPPKTCLSVLQVSSSIHTPRLPVSWQDDIT